MMDDWHAYYRSFAAGCSEIRGTSLGKSFPTKTVGPTNLIPIEWPFLPYLDVDTGMTLFTTYYFNASAFLQKEVNGRYIS